MSVACYRSSRTNVSQERFNIYFIYWHHFNVMIDLGGTGQAVVAVSKLDAKHCKLLILNQLPLRLYPNKPLLGGYPTTQCREEICEETSESPPSNLCFYNLWIT